jgi:signal transduction histidine kinase
MAFEGRGHTLTPTLPAEPLWVHGDPIRLAQVLANLVLNAAKYTDSGGHVQLTAECQGEDVVVRIRDNGIGMTPEVLPLIFKPFFQAERSLDRPEGGLGIALAAARQLVELHGGSLRAFSAGAGCGSEFVVRLPAP